MARRDLKPSELALRRARKLWGKNAAVRLDNHPAIVERGERCTVGVIHAGGLFFSVKGYGDTWEEAFEDAKTRDPLYPAVRSSSAEATK